MKKIILIVLSLVFILFSVSMAAAKEIKKDYHETFDAAMGDILHLRHGDGDVSITPWEKDVLDIKVHYLADVDFFGFGKKHDFRVDFRKTGNTVYVIGKEEAGWTVGFRSIERYEYTYEIQAPAYMFLDLKGDDGDVHIQDWMENIECDLDDGDIHFSNIQAKEVDVRAEDGSLEFTNLTTELSILCDDADLELSDCVLEDCFIDMQDGDLRISQCRGNFEIEADDGDIILDRSRIENLDIRLEDGDIDLDLLTSENPDADIKTDDGNVSVTLERGFSTAFDAWSDDGRIRIKLEEVENFREKRNSKSGEINGGKGLIRIHTSDGNITISER